MARHKFFIRNMGAGSRADYNLHIAHMLWGGLMMPASIFILITFPGEMSGNIAVIPGDYRVRYVHRRGSDPYNPVDSAVM